MPTSGMFPMRSFPFADAREALRRERHLFQDRRIDRPERDIIGLRLQRAIKFGLVMRRDAEAEARAADGGKIGRIEIALAEMDEVAAGVDGMTPVIIDDELRAGGAAERLGLVDFGAKKIVRRVLDAQLHQTHAARQKPRDPV